MARKRDPERELAILSDLPPWEWPDGTKDKLKRFLLDREMSEKSRTEAADLAGNLTVMDDDMALRLLSIVRDRNEPEELRAQAAISLGPALEMMEISDSDDPYDEPPVSEKVYRAIQKTLREAFADESEGKLFRRRVLEAAVRSQEPWQRDAIRAAAQSPDPEWVLTAVFGMRYVRGGFEPEIMKLIESKDPLIQLEAVAAAGSNELKAAWPFVEKLLTSPDTDKDLLLTAIEASSSIDPDEAVDPLTELTHSEDEDIVDAAEEALAMSTGMMEDDGFDDEDDEDDGFVDEDTAPRA